MTCHFHAAVVIALLMLSLGAPPVMARALEDRNWVEVRTANFRVRSLLNEKDTLKLARHLETFRAAVLVVANINRTNAPIPTEIYVMRRGSDFKSFGIDRDTAGVFMPGLRNNTILLRDSDGTQETTTVLHEYAHYLVSNHGNPQYRALLEAGKHDLEAFEEAFGITARQLSRDVKRYLNNGSSRFFTFETDKFLPAFKADVAKLTREQVSLGLARITLERGELDRAAHWFTIALANERTRSRAEAGFGDVLKFRGEFKAAQPRFEQALALAPNDPYSQLDIAEYWHYRAMNADEATGRKAFLESARSHYVKAWKLDDSMPETYAMYGQTFLMQGQYVTAIEMLEEAERLLPANLDIRLILAEAYAGAGLKEKAIEAARSVLVWSHGDDGMASRVREILAQLDSGTE